MSTEPFDELPIITLRVPGNWTSPRDLMQRLDAADTGHVLSLTERPEDSAIVHTATGTRFKLEVAGPDNEIAELFAGCDRITDQEFAAIRDHDVKVFVSGPGGSVESARAVMLAAAALIKAGGLGVLVDNCGATHRPADWIALSDDDSSGGVYWGLVAVTGTPEAVFSTGMHCLGYRDAEVLDPPEDLNAVGYLLHNFLGYSHMSGAILVDGDPIGDPSGPTFRLRHRPCYRFPPGTPFHNPYGIWRLEPIREE